MKKLFLLSLCTCISIFSTFGQTQRKAKFWSIEGRYGQNSSDYSSSFSSSMSQTSRSYLNNSLSINFYKGKFIRNNVALGWGLIYNYQNNLNENTQNSVDNDYSSKSTTIIHTIGINYFLAHFIPVGKGFYLSGEANGYIAHDFNKNNYSYTYIYQNNITKNDKDNKYNNDVIGVGIKVGIRYYPKNKFFINANSSIANASYNWSSNEDFQSNNFTLRGSFDLYNFKLGIGTNF
jgi:hypothetical protein